MRSAHFTASSPGGVAAAVGVHLPARHIVQRQGFVSGFGIRFAGDDAAGVYGGNDALAAELSGTLGDQFRGVDGGGVDGYLVGAGVEHPPHVLDGTDAAAHGEGDKNLFGYGAHHVHHGVAGVAAGGDVEKHQLVSAFLIVAGRQFGRVAGIAQVDETGALDDTAGVNVEARYDTASQHSGVAVRYGIVDE